MAWLSPPVSNADKHWDGAWGLHFLLDSDDPRNKKEPVFGVPDEVLNQKLSKKLMTTLFGETRELFAICSNGTTAVTMAISNSALPSHTRLVAMGSYTGAYSFSEHFSSVPVNIDDFYSRDSLSLERIVPLPYLQRNEIGTPDANKFEDACLSAFKERTLAFAMRGTPVGSLCLELILSGNGLQLSRRFCENLRTICTRQGVSIIADEILTGFRCTARPTVLLSDTLHLSPDFIVLGKFIGCGLVLQDKSLGTSRFLGRTRRYPTTSCPMVTVDHLEQVLRKFVPLVEEYPEVYDNVSTVVNEVFPKTSEGRGLIWFIEDNICGAVPAPYGVRRLLLKLIRRKELPVLKARLANLSTIPRSRRKPGKFAVHIEKFRSVSEEFIMNWATGQSTMFKHKVPHLFGLAYAVRVWVEDQVNFTKRSELHSFVEQIVDGMKLVDVKRVLNSLHNNCGNELFRLSTVSTGRKTSHKVIKPTEFTLRFVGGRQKRDRSSSFDSDSPLIDLVPVCPAHAPVVDITGEDRTGDASACVPSVDI